MFFPCNIWSYHFIIHNGSIRTTGCWIFSQCRFWEGHVAADQQTTHHPPMLSSWGSSTCPPAKWETRQSAWNPLLTHSSAPWGMFALATVNQRMCAALKLPHRTVCTGPSASVRGKADPWKCVLKVSLRLGREISCQEHDISLSLLLSYLVRSGYIAPNTTSFSSFSKMASSGGEIPSV